MVIRPEVNDVAVGVQFFRSCEVVPGIAAGVDLEGGGALIGSKRRMIPQLAPVALVREAPAEMFGQLLQRDLFGLGNVHSLLLSCGSAAARANTKAGGPGGGCSLLSGVDPVADVLGPPGGDAFA